MEEFSFVGFSPDSEKKAPLLCFFVFILITLFILLFPLKIRHKKCKNPYFQPITFFFYSTFRGKSPFFLPPHLGKSGEDPEQGSRSRKEGRAGEREISLLSPWLLLPQRWEVRLCLPAAFPLHFWRPPICEPLFRLK